MGEPDAEKHRHFKSHYGGRRWLPKSLGRDWRLVMEDLHKRV